MALLDERIKNNEIAKIGCLAAKALAAAHKQGVIHRDLKPGNIMLVENGELAVKIIDFGIAKDQDPDNRVIERTVAGQVFGTCSYMAPEQAKGEPITPKADIYGLGAVLYELAQGEPPFTGTSVAEIVANVIRDPLPPIANPEISERLKEIIYRCLEKDQSRRYNTMEELARELSTIGSAQEHADAPEQMIGKIIQGKRAYRIDRRVGAERDTGAYYVARDMDSTIEKYVTIKVTPPNATRTWRERAQKEVETLSRIYHPNIARPIDYRETTGEFDVVFDFVPHASLRELNIASISEEDRLSIAIQATEAIKYAHANGIIHRDMKPGSIFVESVPGSEPAVKVANFGFAKEMAVDTGLTVAGSVVGANSEYMSPEQKTGAPLDQKTDIYSMGLVLREVFFGIKPNQNKEWIDLRRTVDQDNRDLYNLVKQCLKEKDERPNMNYVNETLRNIAAKKRTSKISISDDERTVERPAFNPPAAVVTQGGYEMLQPPPTYAAPIEAVPNVAPPPLPVAQAPQSSGSPVSLVGEETLHEVDLDTLLGRNKARKVKKGIMVAGAVLAIAGVAAGIGLSISNSRQRPNEPRIETIMRDASPVIAVPTPVDAPPIEQDAASQIAVAQDAAVTQTTQVTINANVSGYKVYLMNGTEVCSSGRNESCQFTIDTTGETQVELRKGARRVQLTIDAQGNPIETTATFPRVRRRFEEVEGM
jgi:serine/threonine protein kinase